MDNILKYSLCKLSFILSPIHSVLGIEKLSWTTNFSFLSYPFPSCLSHRFSHSAFTSPSTLPSIIPASRDFITKLKIWRNQLSFFSLLLFFQSSWLPSLAHPAGFSFFFFPVVVVDVKNLKNCKEASEVTEGKSSRMRWEGKHTEHRMYRGGNKEEFIPSIAL